MEWSILSIRGGHACAILAAARTTELRRTLVGPPGPCPGYRTFAGQSCRTMTSWSCLGHIDSCKNALQLRAHVRMSANTHDSNMSRISALCNGCNLCFIARAPYPNRRPVTTVTNAFGKPEHLRLPTQKLVALRRRER
eukprot:6483230-Amphidinium_carterae.1